MVSSGPLFFSLLRSIIMSSASLLMMENVREINIQRLLFFFFIFLNFYLEFNAYGRVYVCRTLEYFQQHCMGISVHVHCRAGIVLFSEHRELGIPNELDAFSTCSLLLIIQRAQKPFHFSGLKLIDCNLATFVNVSKKKILSRDYNNF